MGKFVEHLKRKAESAGCEVIELNAYMNVSYGAALQQV